MVEEVVAVVVVGNTNFAFFHLTMMKELKTRPDHSNLAR